MMRKLILAAAVATISALPALSAPLNGSFEVFAVNVTGVDSAQSEATLQNLVAARANSTAQELTFNYTGDIAFRVDTGGQDANQKITDWFATGTPGGAPALASDPFGQLQLSKSDIGLGTATTTFFVFSMLTPLGASDFTVNHDDGIEFFENGFSLGGSKGPTSEITTGISGYNGGILQFLYVATNGNPSVLEVEVNAVPLPAGLPLLLAGFGSFAYMRRRKAA